MRNPVNRFLVQKIRLYSSTAKEITPPHLGTGSKDVPLQEGKLRMYSMRFCPYAQRTHLMLYAKNIPHDIVNIDLRDKPDWFLKKFPAGKVPALHVDGEYIYESLILADYLEEKYPQRPLLPKDPLLKALDRLVIEEFTKSRKFFLSIYFAPPDEPIDYTPMRDRMDYFEGELTRRGKKFFSGNEPGMVDYMIWPWFERLEIEIVLKSDNGRFKRILQWHKDMIEDPIVKKHYCNMDIHKKYIENFNKGIGDYDNILPK